MKILITGKGGQLAWELTQSAHVKHQLVVLNSQELDISNANLVQQIIAKHKPDIVINAAAYTAVDKAETDKKRAYAVNECGAKHLALGCKANNSRLLHVSTDFIFDGNQTIPYQTNDQPNPINVYGASKLAGEQAIEQILPDTVIVRTAWLYSSHGNNFVKTMLKLMAEKPVLGIVYDQVGTPTWAAGLAQWLWRIVEKPQVLGVYHWTDAGVASWYDFAVAIQDLGIEKGLLKQCIPITAIPASQYPTPAERPRFSVIDKTSAELAANLKTIHWRKQLSNMMDELSSND
ncbi:MAG: dTDP-4-dehydrorhamnose reductase [Flavobacteriales bacterium]